MWCLPDNLTVYIDYSYMYMYSHMHTCMHTYVHKHVRVLYRIFCQKGEIIACGTYSNPGGSGGMLPNENFEIYDL